MGILEIWNVRSFNSIVEVKCEGHAYFSDIPVTFISFCYNAPVTFY